MARLRQRADCLLAAALLALNVRVGSIADCESWFPLCTGSLSRHERSYGRKNRGIYRLKERYSRAAKAVLRAGPLVLGTILLQAAVLGGLVLLATCLATLLALNMGIGTVTTGQQGTSPVYKDVRSAKAVLGGDTFVRSAVLLEAIVLNVSPAKVNVPVKRPTSVGLYVDIVGLMGFPVFGDELKAGRRGG